MNTAMDLNGITRRARREFGLSQGELASCLKLPRQDVIALESGRFVELDERQLEILAIFSDTIPDMLRSIYSMERAAYKKELERKRRFAESHTGADPKANGVAIDTNTGVNTGKKIQEGSDTMESDMGTAMGEITEMVAALPGPMQSAVIASFKAQLQCMVLGAAS